MSSWEHFEAGGTELPSLLKESPVSWSILNTFVCNPNLAFCDLQGLSLLLSNFWSLILIQLQIAFFFFFFPDLPLFCFFSQQSF